MFPVYSIIQDNNKRFAKTYLKVAAAIALITFPLMIGLLALAKPFVLTVFGNKWQSVILLVMILAPVGMAQSIGTTVGAIYQAKGRTDWMFLWGIGSGLLVTFAFVVGLQWGIVGVAVAYAIATFILLYPSFAIPFRLINLKFSSLLKAVWLPFVNSIVMLATVLGFKAVLPVTLSNSAVLGLSVVFGIVVYSAASWMCNRMQIEELWDVAGFSKKRQHASG